MMAYFVNIQSPLHLETSLLAVYRNLEMQVLGRNMWSSSVSRVAFSIESRPSNIDQTLIVACCPLIQLVSSLLRSEDHPYRPGARGKCYNIDTWQYVTLSVTETWPAGPLFSGLQYAYKHLCLNEKSKQSQPWKDINTCICTVCLSLLVCLRVFSNDPWQHLGLSWAPG